MSKSGSDLLIVERSDQTPFDVHGKHRLGVGPSINILSPEILLEIFSLSKTYCGVPSRPSYQNFVGVCRHWRQLAIGKPDLWSHIDIYTDMSTSFSNTMLARTKDVPIHIHICILITDGYVRASIAEQEKDRIRGILWPHIRRVRTLDITCYHVLDDLVTSILDLWLTHGDPGVAKTLRVHQSSMTAYTFFYFPRYIVSTSTNRPGSPKAMISSLKELDLRGASLDWNYHTYHNVVELHLDFYGTNNPPSVSDRQFAHIIAANPNLVSLKLSYFTIIFLSGTEPLEPTTLPRLSLLAILNMSEESLEYLVHSIRTPESSKHSVSVARSLDPTPGCLKDLISRSQVNDLYWQHFDFNEPMSADFSFLKLLPHLETLGIKSFSIDDTFQSSPGLAVPRLLRIILSGCNVSLQGLTNFLRAYNTQELTIEKCTPMKGESLEEIEVALSELYPALKCVVTNVVSVWKLGHCGTNIVIGDSRFFPELVE